MPEAVRPSPVGLCTPAKPSLLRSPAISCQTLARVATAVGMLQGETKVNKSADNDAL